MEELIKNGKIFRLVTVRGRSKWISKDGEAYNIRNANTKAKIHINPDGYPCFGGGIPVYLYVAYGWVDGWFDGAEVDHIDYDRTNYNYDNLRWVTHETNVKHSYEDTDRNIGIHSGENNGRSVMTIEHVNVAKDMFSTGMCVMDVIKTFYPEYDLKQRRRLWNRYNRIKTGETWS